MSKPSNPAEKFLIRYNFVILILISATVIGAGVYLSSQTYFSSLNPTQADVKSEIPTNFDNKTSQKIEQLHTSDQSNINVTTPSGRYDPFSE